MRILLAAAALMLVPAAAYAGDTATAAEEPAARLNLDTPIEQIVADPAGKAVLDADVPGITTHPHYEMFKGMSLRAVQPYSKGKLTDDIMDKVKTDLAAIK